jgi:hypothetical protein
MRSDPMSSARYPIVLLLGVMSVSGALAAGVYEGQAAANYESSFCTSRANEYFAPLERMKPPIHVPATGRLGFGPKDLRLHIVTSPLLTRKERIGFVLRGELGGRRRIPLDWTALVRLSEVSASGRVLRVVRELMRPVGTVGGDGIVLGAKIPRLIAFYRVDLAFESSRGKRLGSFREYFRGVRARFGARLETDRRVYPPESEATARWINGGTTWIGVGEGFAIQHLVDGQWIRAPFSPSGPWTLGLIRVSPGVSRCFTFAIPADAPRGNYRVSKSVFYISPRELIAPFMVSK